ncbi:hypothetical protein ABHI03_004684 [Salmonella enterica subsp. enterica serovar Braenderup]|nr:hypothetical protein [Salmonella enterica subsp. enterica serovar Mbandaka]EAN5120967.1 hypothetical protein [Salmonella enterica]EDY0526030.1 hypothetical protein [Salmonella enterica subsp. enterica serovar Bareilly]HCT7900293.1 hypothetical protein [Enterobacter cloacae]EAQ3114382.1 hypothetical protein [Salmonella enterica]
MMAKRGFFNLGKAVDDVRKADGIADTGLASLSLVGKGLFNVARFAVTEGLDQLTKTTGKSIIENEKSSEEQKEKARENIAKAEARQAEREAKDREWEANQKEKM